jgi:hypothetical protein
MRLFLKTPEPNPKFTQRVTFPQGTGEFSGVTVEIVYYVGVANEIPDNLGRYLIDMGYASATPYTLITPGASSLILPERKTA